MLYLSLISLRIQSGLTCISSANIRTHAGKELAEVSHKTEIEEVFVVIQSVDSKKLLTRKAKQTGLESYGSKSVNDAFKSYFEKLGWKHMAFGLFDGVVKIGAEVEEGYWAASLCKNGIGVSMEFGRNGRFGGVGVLLSNMAFFQSEAIECCAIIVPSARFAACMPSGIDTFEGIIKSLDRLENKPDMPLLVLDVDA